MYPFHAKHFTRFLRFLPILVLLGACQSAEEKEQAAIRRANEVRTAVTRKLDDHVETLPLAALPHPHYPWEDRVVGGFPRLTHDFFRCRGNAENPPLVQIDASGEELSYEDCRGSLAHSLPFIDGKETVYPILIELLNWLQAKTEKRVVITSGHRCPKHNTYVDPSKGNQISKHLIGAEVSFYVEGMEEQPEQLIGLLEEFYAEEEQSSLREFRRYSGSTNVRTQPWFNKEVFIKLFQADEGRNGDNTHTYPYVSIQVRWDRASDKQVAYTWKGAHFGYFQWIAY